MEDQKDLLQLVYNINALQEAGFFDHPDVFNQLRAIIQNHSNSEMDKSAKELINQFVEFFRKNSTIDIVRIKKSEPERLYMDGVFDMVHSGHFNAIRQAKLLCDILVMGVVSDYEVEVTKGPPVMNLKERVELISACKWVDEVASDDIPYSPSIELIDKLNCQFVGHGDDLALSADGTDCYSIIKKAGRMRTFKRTEGISTTDIVGRILLLAKDPTRHQTKLLKKMSGDNIITSSNVDKVVETSKSHINYNPSAFQLLQTTRRMKQFSSNREPKPDDKVVYVDGSFDLLHIGHVRILKKARELGTFVVVGIYDDETVEHLRGEHYPLLNVQERVLNILALKYVDEVVIGAPYVVTQQLLNMFNVTIVLKGSETPVDEKVDYEITENDPYQLPKKLGIFKKVWLDCNVTSENLITRIIENRQKIMEANEKKKKKQELYYQSMDSKVKEN